ESIRKSLLDNYDTYVAAIAESGRAQDAIARLLQGVDDLQSTFGDEETGIRARLLSAVGNEARLEGQLRGSQAVLQCLRYLSEVNSSLKAMDALVRSNRLLEAANAIQAIEKTLDDSEAIEGARIKDSLYERISMAKLNVKENALRTIRELLVVNADKTCVQLRAVSVGGQSPRDLAQSLFAALDILSAGDEVKEAFSAYFVRTFVRPVLSALSISHNSTEDDLSFSVEIGDLSQTITAANEVCSIIADSISFADRTLCCEAGTENGKSSKAPSIWTEQCGIDIAKLVLERCFLHSIPTARNSLAEFSSVVNALLSFEKRLADLRLLPSEEGETQSRPISEAVRQLDSLYVARRCDAALTQIRAAAEDASFDLHSLEAQEIWTPELVRTLATDADCELSPVVIQAAGRLMSDIASRPDLKLANVFPRCAISKSMHGLVLAAYRLANEAALFPPSSIALSRTLCASALNLFDLYRALFLTLHRTELTKIPSLAWQFFNDCMYASHHARLLGRFIPALLEDLGENAETGSIQSDWDATARLFFGVGNAHIANLVERESKELRDLVSSSSDGFYNASNEGEKAQLAKMAKQVRLAVSQLAKAMRPPVISPHIFYSTLGHYIDAVFARTIEGVTDVRDIGVDDSQVLSEHCRSLHSLTSLFQLDPSTLAAYKDLDSALGASAARGSYADDLLDSDDEAGAAEPQQGSSGGGGGGGSGGAKIAKDYSKLSDKLLQLADILLISRADILARRRAGLLAQFTADELIGLIRALFSDTKERAHDIEVIRTLS
ncbi:hypothetical protein GQ54DRAFT_258488, partial [Martensiomyces pterosporus]